MKITPYAALVACVLLSACNEQAPVDTSIASLSQTVEAVVRDESPAQIAQGATVFEQHCQVCHGVAAAGVVKNWQELDANGNIPPPPLNGTAHAWHHNQKALLRTVNNGGQAVGGTMPPFKDKLSEAEKVAVLAYIKSLWPDELYAVWKQRNAEK